MHASMQGILYSKTYDNNMIINDGIRLTILYSYLFERLHYQTIVSTINDYSTYLYMSLHTLVY